MATNPYSIVDYLNSQGKDSSYNARRELARQQGNVDYTGSEADNTSLLSFLRTSSAPTVPKTSTTPSPATNTITNNDPLQGGARGLFLDDKGGYVDEKTSNEIGTKVNESLGFGVPMSEVGDYYSDPAYRIPTLSGDESAGISTSFGFGGIGNKNEFAGMTRAEALAKAESKKSELQKNVSQNTSGAYNSDFLNASSSSKKLLDAYNIGLKDIKAYPFDPEEAKSSKANSLLENTMNGLTGLFKDVGEFDNLYNKDPAFKATIDQFRTTGGNIDTLRSKLPQPPKEEFKITSGDANTDKLMSPQTEVLKSNIEYLKSVPEEYKKFYFGDEGYFNKIRKEAEASLVALEESSKTVEKDTLQDFDNQYKKNEAESAIRLAEIEESRATNKNYLNGMLAKLGALTTSGEAPVAIARLDAKYDTLQSQTKTALSTAQSALSSAKTEAISKIQNDRLNKIATVKSDLSKSSFEIQKELMKIDEDTRKEINKEITDWQKSASTITKDAMNNAEKTKLEYNKLYAKTASGGLLSNKTLNALTTNGQNKKYGSDLEAVIGNTISIIPTKFGQEQFQSQLSRARNDGDKINLVASQVLKNQPSEVRLDFGNQAIAINSIDKAIALLDSGVETGVLNNAKQYAANFAGKDYDPALAQLNSLITSAIQPYRSSVTGAAWGTQEEAEYASLFGSTKYSPAELKQRLSTLKEGMKAKSSNALNAYVNPTGASENIFNTGTLAPQTPYVAPAPAKEASWLERLTSQVKLPQVTIGQPTAQTKVINGVNYVKVQGGWKKQ